MKVIQYIIAILICFIILYGSILFVIWTNQCIFNNEMTILCYLLPIIIPVVLIGITFLSRKINDVLYSIIYYIVMVILGYFLYIFLTSLIIRLLDGIIDINKVILLPIFYGLPALVCIYGIINAKISKIVRIVLKFKGYKDKINILHLTDIHLGAIHQKKSIQRIVEEAQELNPDIIVITGDMADGSLKVKKEWLEPLNNLTMPILYVTGNHEEMNPKKDFIDAVLTTNMKYIGEHGKFMFKNVNFIGEDFGYDLRQCLVGTEQNEGIPNVLLSHVPNMTPDDIAKYNIFLFLAGHTHGGQVFPLQIFAYMANACFSGLYSDKEKQHFVYVSDGVNNAMVPMRVGSSRIMAMITIEGDEGEQV